MSCFVLSVSGWEIFLDGSSIEPYRFWIELVSLNLNIGLWSLSCFESVLVISLPSLCLLTTGVSVIELSKDLWFSLNFRYSISLRCFNSFWVSFEISLLMSRFAAFIFFFCCLCRKSCFFFGDLELVLFIDFRDLDVFIAGELYLTGLYYFPGDFDLIFSRLRCPVFLLFLNELFSFCGLLGEGLLEL